MANRQNRSTITLIAVCFGLFMIQLDLTVVNVALKSIQENLRAGVTALQWVVDAYAVLFSSLMLTTGDLGDLFGRRRMYAGGMVLFVLGSISCALAPSYVFLIGARSLQGVGAAAALPNSLAILRNAFPDARLRARAIGWWAGVSGLAVVAGPTLGGALVGHFGWRSVFWVNLPVGLLGLWLTLQFVSESSHPQGRRLDIWGQILAISALVSLIFAAIEGQQLGWGNTWIIAAFVLAGISGMALYLVERRHSHPMLDFHFFKEPVFTASNAASGLMNFGVFATLFAFSLYLLHVQRLSPEQVGLHLAVMFAPFAASLPFGGRITGHFGSRYPAALGLGATGLGMLWLALALRAASDVWMFSSLFIIGLGLAAATPALVAAAIGALPPERSGAASAFNNTSRQACGALGVALLGGLVGVGASATSDGVMAAISGSAVALLLGAIISWWFIRHE